MGCVSIRPKEYLEQGLRYCAGYTIKSILSALSKDDGRKPKMYLPFFNRLLGGSTPSLIVNVFRRFGVGGKVGQASSLTALDVIKKEIDSGFPIILLVGNGYSHGGSFSSLRRSVLAHWISVWGYDDEKSEFYVYDSFAHQYSWDDAPIGNKRRHYAELLRDWKGTFYSPSYLYIKVRKRPCL